MDGKIVEAEPPQLWPYRKHNHQRQRSMNSTMCCQWCNKIPARHRLFQHIFALQREITDKVFYLKNNEQNKKILYIGCHLFKDRYKEYGTQSKYAERRISHLMTTPTEVQNNQENPFLNLAFNIVLPVFILNKLSSRLGEDGHIIALLLALAIPILYGAYDYWKRRKHNLISALGIINIAVTGGFALLNLNGHWFALKEAFFPLLIGFAVLVSNWLNAPYLRTLFWTENVFRVSEINQILEKEGRTQNLHHIFKRATYLFAISFLISAVLNFMLAIQIFTPIDPILSKAAYGEILNKQIEQMTWKGYVVIALPMMIFMMGILWYIIGSLRKLTGRTFESLLKDEHSHSTSSS